MPKRKHFSASQKAQIALEILKEEKTINQIASEFGVHPNVLYRLKKQALENLSKLFEDENKSERERQAEPDRQVNELFGTVCCPLVYRSAWTAGVELLIIFSRNAYSAQSSTRRCT